MSFSAMLSMTRILFSTVLSAFRAIWYPIDVVLAFIANASRDRTLRTSSEELAPRESDDLTTRVDDLLTVSNIEIVEVRRYYPPGVSEIISRGGESFIGLLDQFTVLKYPCIPGNNESIQIEARLLEVLGNHPRIIPTKGLTEHGLILERALNGCLHDYITSHSAIPFDRRLLWCKQAAEAVSFIHGKYVIHCDINLRNFLLDKDLGLVLADFQGMLKSVDGRTLLDGLSRECSKSFMPRPHGDYACVRTDLFALGSAIYFIMTGHEVFPELDSLEDDEEILSRFKKELFPIDNHACYHITEKCWKQQYRCADEVVFDISRIQDFKIAAA